MVDSSPPEGGEVSPILMRAELDACRETHGSIWAQGRFGRDGNQDSERAQGGYDRIAPAQGQTGADQGLW